MFEIWRFTKHEGMLIIKNELLYITFIKKRHYRVVYSVKAMIKLFIIKCIKIYKL